MIKVRPTKHQLTIPSDGERLAETRGFIALVAGKYGFSAADIFDLQVAVGEAVSNAVEHGSPAGPLNKIEIDCFSGDGGLTVVVKDQGVFKKAVRIDQEFSTRGHGILLMLALMDKVTIDESAHGTTVTLIKRY